MELKAITPPFHIPSNKTKRKEKKKDLGNIVSLCFHKKCKLLME